MGTARFPLVRLKNASTSARLFSSSTAPIRRRWSHSEDVSDESDGESTIYKRALKLQRPSTVKYQELLHNFVSLIGQIERPLKACNSKKFGVHTFLRAKASSRAYGDFGIMLKFWDEMAESAFQHLKLHDLVYVSGRLGSYVKADKDGKLMHNHEVTVTEMNFIAQHSLGPACQNRVKLESEVSPQDIMQKRINRLHLWQVFFANPYEWWDNRNRKLHPRSPDFEHKDTKEALWIRENDPPWINQQLQLHDSRWSRGRPGERRKNLSPLVYDDDQRT